MKKFLIDDLSDVAYAMYENIVEDVCQNVMFVGFYEDASAIIKELLMYDEIIPYNISIEPIESDNYDKEYYIALDNNFNIWCCKAYDVQDKCYLWDTTDCLFIADDCFSAILKEIGCDDDNMYEVSYDLDDEECACDGDCACCNCNDGKDDNYEVITRVAVDDNGVIRGFEKTWETKEGNMTYHSTYTHYSNNTELLKQLMENFDIKF